MEDIFSYLLVAVLLFTLTGCGNGEVSIGSIDSINTESTAETNTSAEAKQSIFTGKIERVTISEDKTIHVQVSNVVGKSDPGNIATSFAHDDVILNAKGSQIKGGVETLEVGKMVVFTLVKMPSMTMSIPPQVPGNSIIEITISN